MKIYLGADHNGVEYKQKLADLLSNAGHKVIDDSANKLNPEDDYPKFAAKVVNDLLTANDPNARGILICGSGQGMCMAANRFRGIRASLCWNIEEARAARNDDDSNVLCLAAHYLSIEETEAITNAWLATPFAGAQRFKRRIRQLDDLTP